jgi:hypothetical protein
MLGLFSPYGMFLRFNPRFSESFSPLYHLRGRRPGPSRVASSTIFFILILIICLSLTVTLLNSNLSLGFVLL